MSLANPSTRLARVGALVAAVALVVSAVVSLADSQSGEETVRGVEHVALAGFTVSWLALVPVIMLIGRRGAPRIAAAAAVAQTALGLLGLVSNVRGEDPSFFAAVAVPANLVILVSWIALAVILGRRGRLSRGLAIALPVAFIGMIPLSMVGGGLLAAAVWVAYARSLGEPAPVRSAQPAGLATLAS